MDSQPRDAAYWAKNVTTLKLGQVPAEAVNLNVTGKRVVGPVQGFGKLWQKTYRVELPGASYSPAEVITAWKAAFASFWPDSGRFYGKLTGIDPGDVALLNLSAGGMKLSTGILVLYADDESFTFMTPEGHMLSAWITFSASQVDGVTVAQAQALERTSDPFDELMYLLGGNRMNDRFWVSTLENLARHVGVAEPSVSTQVTCIDRRRQWRQAGNLRHSASLRTARLTVTAPVRWVRRRTRSAG